MISSDVMGHHGSRCAGTPRTFGTMWVMQFLVQTDCASGICGADLKRDVGRSMCRESCVDFAEFWARRALTTRACVGERECVCPSRPSKGILLLACHPWPRPRAQKGEIPVPLHHRTKRVSVRGPVSTVRGYCDPEVPPDARRAAEAAGAQAKYEAYKEGVTAGSCLSRGVAPPGAGPA